MCGGAGGTRGCRYAEPIYPTLGAQFPGGVDRKYQSRIGTGAFLAHRTLTCSSHLKMV